jgi:alginate O-acetyltransferase complex protein AlgI
VLNNTLAFWSFFLLVYVLYWFVARTPRSRVVLLLVANAAFYVSWDVRLIWVPVAISYVAFRGARSLAAIPDPVARARMLRNTIVIAVLLLVAFRYVSFLRDNLQLLLDWTGASLPVVLLPQAVGVSFMTCAAISYTIDVHRETCEPEPSFVKLLTSISLFPIAVAGPITRPKDLVPQLDQDVRLQREDFQAALFLIAVGLFKKTLADGIGALIGGTYDGNGALDTAISWAAGLGYLAQLYADFSGYSDIAIGTALLLGIRIPLNFRLPLLAPSPVQFWRRWHISLALWLRDYLFVSLGLRTPYRSLFLTWVIAGVWHGPTWSMVVWGIYCAVMITGTAFLTRVIPLSKATLKRIYVARWLLTLYTWVIACVILRAPDLARAWDMIRAMHRWDGGFLFATFATIVLAIATCVVGHVLDAAALSGWLTKRRTVNTAVWVVLVFVLLTFVFVINPGSAAFIYGSF